MPGKEKDSIAKAKRDAKAAKRKLRRQGNAEASLCINKLTEYADLNESLTAIGGLYSKAGTPDPDLTLGVFRGTGRSREKKNN